MYKLQPLPPPHAKISLTTPQNLDRKTLSGLNHIVLAMVVLKASNLFATKDMRETCAFLCS